VDEVAGAIADPVRREILLMLRDERLSAGQIAARFDISRPAISRHLRVLRAAGLVRDEAEGRRRVYTLVTTPLADLAGWMTELMRPPAWHQRLDALETEVYRTRRDRRAADDHSGGGSSAVDAHHARRSGDSESGRRGPRASDHRDTGPERQRAAGPDPVQKESA
jgi:DNA-binding transcriptional ArsR family regulator